MMIGKASWQARSCPGSQDASRAGSTRSMTTLGYGIEYQLGNRFGCL